MTTYLHIVSEQRELQCVVTIARKRGYSEDCFDLREYFLSPVRSYYAILVHLDNVYYSVGDSIFRFSTENVFVNHKNLFHRYPNMQEETLVFIVTDYFDGILMRRDEEMQSDPLFLEMKNSGLLERIKQGFVIKV